MKDKIIYKLSTIDTQRINGRQVSRAWQFLVSVPNDRPGIVRFSLQRQETGLSTIMASTEVRKDDMGTTFLNKLSMFGSAKDVTISGDSQELKFTMIGNSTVQLSCPSKPGLLPTQITLSQYTDFYRALLQHTKSK